jgi:hypothetical protein
VGAFQNNSIQSRINFLKVGTVASCIVFLVSVFASAQNFNPEENAKDNERLMLEAQLKAAREKKEQEILNMKVSDQEIEKAELVEVEPLNILPSDMVTVSPLVPYGVRRTKWGIEGGVAYSMFEPINYETDYLDPTLGDFETFYGSGDTPLIEFQLGGRRNFSFCSVALNLGYGVYANEADDDALGDAKLDLQIVRLGLRLTLDSLFIEPYIVPYGEVGAYTVAYDETQDATSFNGTTEAALYYTFGASFSLNWLDPSAATEAYTNSGVENTYLFVEGRQFMASGNETDPDFSSDLYANFGMAVEF